jgi:alpha-tubulin suppressor-like RCC1 family protein
MRTTIPTCLAALVCACGGGGGGGGGAPASDAPAALALGRNHSCALMQSGAVRCWGGNGGDGLLGVPPAEVVTTTTPVAVRNLSGATAVSAGESHTCAVAGGAVRCWGSDTSGELGKGAVSPGWDPSTVPSVVAAAVAAGRSHTCALTTGGGVACWGDNTYKQLGNAGVTGSRSLAPVAAGAFTGARAVGAGWYFGCVEGATGGVACWGENPNGQLGRGATSITPSVDPAPATSLSGVSHLAVGPNHSCAVVTGGAVKCWGYNFYGETGVPAAPTPQAQNISTPTAVSGLAGPATAVAAGEGHSCALLAAGTVQCWGHNNDYAELGDATYATTNVPVTVLGVSGAVGLAAGAYHTCALLTGGRVKCWGRNDAQQSGDARPGHPAVPIAVEVGF